MKTKLFNRVVFLSFFLALVVLIIPLFSPSLVFAALSNDSTATVTAFTVSDETIGATDVTYTLTFTLSDPIEPDGDNMLLDFDLNRITTPTGDTDSNMAIATGTFSSLQYQNPDTQEWVNIDFGDTDYFHKEISNQNLLIWGFGYIDLNTPRHGIQTTIPANTPVRLIMTGVTNPILYGAYALSVQVRGSNGNNYSLEIPYNHPQRSVRANIGDYCAKLKVLKPTGSDGMTGVDFFISSSIAPSISGQWGIYTRTDYAGAVYLYADSFNGIDHCPSGAGEAINAQVMLPGDYVNTLHYLNPNQVTLTLDTDKDKYFSTPLRMTVANKTITGTVLYSNNDVGVSSATVSTFKMNGSGYFQTTTDSEGNYTLLVGGGDWGVMPQSQGNGDWAYGSGPTNLKFINDNSTESKTVNFEVDRASSTIRCRILKPDGTPVGDPDGYGVGAFSMQGSGGNGQSAGAGVYNIRVPAGSYNINIMAPFNSTYGAPTMDPVTVKENETKDIGDITLVAKDATITGSLKVAGVGIPGISVNANKRNGNGWASATTDASGNFTIPVIAGEWMIMPMLNADSNYAMVDPPQDVSVASGASANVNLTLQSASATINGSLVDGDGNPASVYGYAFADRASGGMFGPGGMGGSIERGNFSFKVPAGSYTVNAGLAPGSPYTQGDSVNVVITDGETKNVTLVVKNNDAIISGSIVDESGNTITDANINIFANSGGMGGGHNAFQQGTLNGDGTYTINVSSGDWILGYFIDPSSGYMSSPPNPDDKFTITSGQTVTKNITLRAANSTITGTVLKADGVTPETGAFISVDQRGGGTEGSEGKGFFNGAQTNQSGVYTVKISSGSYKVRVNIQPGTGYISPPEETVVVAANEISTKNFTLRESNATITGKITLGGVETMAFVYAWADDGGFAQSMSGFNGNYSLDVSSGTTWHVGGGYETGTNAYRSEETAVTPANGSSSTVNLALVKSDYDLPQSLTVQFDSTKPKVIELTDGTELNIPANALDTGGNVTLNINPKTSLPSKKGDRPIWYGYEFSATDSDSQTITSFNSDITISFPYTDAQLVKLGVTADQLVPSYWDTTTGSWKQVSNVTIDTTNHMVVITTDHFTDYALTANYTVTSNNNSNNSNNTTSNNSASTNSTSSSGSNTSCGSQAPTNTPYLFEIRRSGDQAKLFFSPAGDPVSYYYIAYGPKNNPQQHGVSFDQSHSSGVLNFTINKLNTGDYYFSIRAGNGCMPGAWSNTMLAKSNRTSYYSASVKASTFSSNKTKVTPPSTKTIKKPETVVETIQPVITTSPIAPPSPPTPVSTPKPKKKCFLWWCF